MSALDSKTLLYEEKQIYTPELSELKSVLQNGLKSNFKEVKVEVVDCPDLTQAPFHLASPGLSGDGALIEYGGVPYLLPLVDKSKLYDLKELIRNVSGYEEKEFYTCGAGAGPFPLFDQNCEGIFNLRVTSDGQVFNETHSAKVNPDGSMELHKVPLTETRTALLGNVFLCEGKPGQVLKVVCKTRIGSENFISAVRNTLAEYYTDDKTVGLGGVFLLKNGKANQHVMDDFSKTPITTEEELNNWLKFYEMPAPLIAVGTLVTNEADLDLRLQHFHSFSKHGKGGHYHYDVTPETVEYEGYFNVGARIVRVDKPTVTHKFGRD
ncbi:unnamed protein product [Diamesa tonsa]